MIVQKDTLASSSLHRGASITDNANAFLRI